MWACHECCVNRTSDVTKLLHRTWNNFKLTLYRRFAWRNDAFDKQEIVSQNVLFCGYFFVLKLVNTDNWIFLAFYPRLFKDKIKSPLRTNEARHPHFFRFSSFRWHKLTYQWLHIRQTGLDHKELIFTIESWQYLPALFCDSYDFQSMLFLSN